MNSYFSGLTWSFPCKSCCRETLVYGLKIDQALETTVQQIEQEIVNDLMKEDYLCKTLILMKYVYTFTKGT